MNTQYRNHRGLQPADGQQKHQSERKNAVSEPFAAIPRRPTPDLAS
jgi:hypothetical protein